MGGMFFLVFNVVTVEASPTFLLGIVARGFRCSKRDGLSFFFFFRRSEFLFHDEAATLELRTVVDRFIIIRWVVATRTFPPTTTTKKEGGGSSDEPSAASMRSRDVPTRGCCSDEIQGSNTNIHVNLCSASLFKTRTASCPPYSMATRRPSGGSTSLLSRPQPGRCSTTRTTPSWTSTQLCSYSLSHR